MANIEELWRKFSKNRGEKERQEIIKYYLPFAKSTADRITAYLPDHVRANSRDDLYVEGIIGLISSIERFDPGKNIKFETFASKRIRGSVLDALRKEDLLPKNVREQAKKVENAYMKLEAELGRDATDEEIIEELRMTKKEFYGILQKIKGITLVSLEEGILNSDGEKYYYEDLVGEEATADRSFEKKQVLEKLTEFIDNLDREERIILETYYWDGLTLKEIGKVLNLSESRVCQVHTKIILKLRSSFRKLEQER